MKAIGFKKVGGLSDLEVLDIPLVVPGQNEALVKVSGVGLNPADIKRLKGQFGAVTAFPYITGSEFSGTITELGSESDRYSVGDQVYGIASGSLAEFVCARFDQMSFAPPSLELPVAGAVPVGAMTAWQALVTQGNLKAGQRVLIHAAAGGVGTYAVQIAKELGAYVIGTAGADNKHYLERLGADEVIDYRAVSFEKVVQDVDLVLESVGGESTHRSRSVLKKGGTLVAISGQVNPEEFEAEGKRGLFWSLQPNCEDLDHISAMIEDLKLTVIVSDQVPFERSVEAFRLLDTGHVRGKLLVVLEG